MNREEILNGAKDCVCVDRENTYGKPEDNFATIANLWSKYLFAKGVLAELIDSDDVAVMMALLKIARIATGKPKADNFIDLAGYAACAGEIATKNI